MRSPKRGPCCGCGGIITVSRSNAKPAAMAAKGLSHAPNSPRSAKGTSTSRPTKPPASEGFSRNVRVRVSATTSVIGMATIAKTNEAGSSRVVNKKSEAVSRAAAIGMSEIRARFMNPPCVDPSGSSDLGCARGLAKLGVVALAKGKRGRIGAHGFLLARRRHFHRER